MGLFDDALKNAIPGGDLASRLQLGLLFPFAHEHSVAAASEFQGFGVGADIAGWFL